MSEVLYEPKNKKDLRIQYPELHDIPQFKPLTKNELLMTWYYSNPTSPVFVGNVGHEKSVEKSIEYVFDEEAPKEFQLMWLSKSWPTYIQDAIDKWKSMRPEFRTRSKKMIERMIVNLEKMVDVSDDDFIQFDNEGNPTKKVDWSARNQYANFCRTTSQMLPDLISTAEQGFGITNKEKDKKPGEKSIEKFHKIKD